MPVGLSRRRALERHTRRASCSWSSRPIKHLESLVGFGNAAEALEAARRREVKPVEPEVVGEGEERRIVLPDELP